jgi:hypothetical protein
MKVTKVPEHLCSIDEAILDNHKLVEAPAVVAQRYALGAHFSYRAAGPVSGCAE